MLAKRVQKKIDTENNFELQETLDIKEQTDTFASVCPIMCPGRDSNPHERNAPQILSLLWLPFHHPGKEGDLT
ncbi:MAG: hypothetical protein RLZZ308_244 [Candidatus Parcubacteria bacterium]